MLTGFRNHFNLPRRICSGISTVIVNIADGFKTITLENRFVSDEPSDSGSPFSDMDSSEEWVEAIAAAEEIPPEDVIERLVSSYWTLKEMNDLLGGSGADIDFETDDTDFESSGTGPSTEVDSPVADIEEIRERLDTLEEIVEEGHETREAVEIDLANLTQRVDALHEQLLERQSSLESRFDSELENLETILEYLIDTTDDHDAELGSISSEYKTVRHRQAELDQLADLKRIASQQGIQSATCDHCGTTVDLGLLPSAECPLCDRRFVDIEPATGWFGLGSDILLTAHNDSTD